MYKINKTDNLHNHHRLAPPLGTRHIVLQKDILMGQFQPQCAWDQNPGPQDGRRRPVSTLVEGDEGCIGYCVHDKQEQIMQHMYGNNPFMFDCWAYPVVNLLLLKSSMISGQ